MSPPRDPKKLLLSLTEVYGSKGNAKVAAITKVKQAVFHAVGDTGPARRPKTVQEVMDKICADMQEANLADVPSFFYHLVDVACCATAMRATSSRWRLWAMSRIRFLMYYLEPLTYSQLILEILASGMLFLAIPYASSIVSTLPFGLLSDEVAH